MTIKPLGRVLWMADNDGIGKIDSVIELASGYNLICDWEDGRVTLEGSGYVSSFFSTRALALAAHEQLKAEATDDEDADDAPE